VSTDCQSNHRALARVREIETKVDRRSDEIRLSVRGDTKGDVPRRTIQALRENTAKKSVRGDELLAIAREDESRGACVFVGVEQRNIRLGHCGQPGADDMNFIRAEMKGLREAMNDGIVVHDARLTDGPRQSDRSPCRLRRWSTLPGVWRVGRPD